MRYAYETDRPSIEQTDFGKEIVGLVLDSAQQRGEFTTLDIINAVVDIRSYADSWHILNALDLLTEQGKLVHLTAGENVWGQHRRYRVA